jgi:SAM-dependent methyltransferase
MYHPILPAYSTLCSLYYDAVKAYAGAAETDFYASFIQRHPGRALEAMSGSGRLAIPLLQRGYVVDGVDNSSAMLTRCQERLMALGLTMQQYNQSLEELALPHCYSVITIAVGSFQLITQRDTALLTLQKLYEHLLPGGVLLIDFFIPDLEAEPTSHQVQLDQTRSLQLTKRHFF